MASTRAATLRTFVRSVAQIHIPSDHPIKSAPWHEARRQLHQARTTRWPTITTLPYRSVRNAATDSSSSAGQIADDQAGVGAAEAETHHAVSLEGAAASAMLSGSEILAQEAAAAAAVADEKPKPFPSTSPSPSPSPPKKRGRPRKTPVHEAPAENPETNAVRGKKQKLGSESKKEETASRIRSPSYEAPAGDSDTIAVRGKEQKLGSQSKEEETASRIRSPSYEAPAEDSETIAVHGKEQKLGSQSKEEKEASILQSPSYEAPAEDSETIAVYGKEQKLGSQSKEEKEASILYSPSYEATAENLDTITVRGKKRELKSQSKKEEEASILQSPFYEAPAEDPWVESFSTADIEAEQEVRERTRELQRERLRAERKERKVEEQQQREMERQRREKERLARRPHWMIQKEALKKKFPEGWKPLRKLSPDAQRGIRELNQLFPDTYTTPVLANKFEVSPEAIRRILKAKWAQSPEVEEDRQRRWHNRGVTIWEHYAALGMKPPARWREQGVGVRSVASQVDEEGEIVSSEKGALSPGKMKKPKAPQDLASKWL